MERLNAFELSVLMRIAAENKAIGAGIERIVPMMRVAERKFTGVGAYINFQVSEGVPEFGNGHFGLSSPINIPGLEMGLTAELACENGKPLFLELVTTDPETWAGDSTGFSFGDSVGAA